jgi:hypothetical protein
MLKYRVQLCVQMLFFGLLALLAVYAGYRLAIIMLDVLDMKYKDGWTGVWVSVLSAEIVVAGWFLVRCAKTIGWNARRLFRRSH